MRVTTVDAAHSGEAGPARFRIETIEDYELATQRIAVLDLASRSDEEQREREALVDAVQHWDRKHDDVTGWKDRP